MVVRAEHPHGERNDPGPENAVTVYIDTGYYQLPTDVRVTAADAGVRFVGPATTLPLGAGYSALVGADSPVAYYRFNETSGTVATDSSGRGADATYLNGVSLGAAGAWVDGANLAARFDGVNDQVELPDGFANFTSGFTLEIWVYPTSAAAWSRLFDIGRGQASDNIVLARYDTTSDLELNVLRGATSGGTLRATGILEMNRWQHIVATVDTSGSARLY